MDKLQTPLKTTNEDLHGTESAMPPSAAPSSDEEHRATGTPAPLPHGTTPGPGSAAAADDWRAGSGRTPARFGETAVHGGAPGIVKNAVGRPKTSLPHLELRKRKGRKPVYVIYDGKVQISTKTNHRCEAERRFLRYLSEKAAAAGEAAGSIVGVPPGDRTIAEIVADWWARSNEKPGTVRRQRLRARDDLLIPFWAGKTMEEITPNSCDAYYAARKGASKRLASGTARTELKRLKTLVDRYGKRNGVVFRPTFKLPPASKPRDKALSRRDVARLVCAARGRWWDEKAGDWKRTADGRLTLRKPESRASTMTLVRLILLGVFTGTRADAMLRARWNEDPANPHVDVEEENFHRRGASEPETSKRRPVARIATELLRLVRRWKVRDDAKRCDRVVTRYEVSADRKVVPTCAAIEKVSDAGEIFRALRRFAGLPGVTIHTLRHTCATWLLEVADIQDVADFLGLTVDELEATYAKYDEARTAPAARALNEWGRGRRPGPTGKGFFPKESDPSERGAPAA